MITFKSALRRLRNFRLGGRLLRSLGYSTLFSVLFAFFLILSLPLNRFIPNIEGLLEQKLDRKVRIGDISTTMTGGLVMDNLSIGLNESEDEEAVAVEVEGDESEDKNKPKRPVLSYNINELALSLSYIPLLFGELDFAFDADGLGGDISVAYRGAIPDGSGSKDTKRKLKRKTKRRKTKSKKRTRNGDKSEEAEEEENEETEEAEETENDEVPMALNVQIEDIELRQIHDLRDLLPVPVMGTLNMTVDLASESSGLEKASGTITFSIKDLMFSKKGHEASIMGSSLIVPPIKVDSLEGAILFEEGVGKVSKFKMVSRHVDMDLEGIVTLKDPISKSVSNLYLTFTIKDSYLQESAAIKTLYDSVDLFSSVMKRAHRDDGYYGFTYRGIFGKGRFGPALSFVFPGEKKEKKSTAKRSRTRRSNRSSKSSSRASRTSHNPIPSVSPVASTPMPTTTTTPPSPPEPVRPTLHSSGSMVNTSPTPGAPNFNRIGNETASRPVPPPRPGMEDDDDEEEEEVVPPRLRGNRRRSPSRRNREEAEEEEAEEEEGAAEEEEAEEEGAAAEEEEAEEEEGAAEEEEEEGEEEAEESNEEEGEQEPADNEEEAEEGNEAEGA